MKQEKEYSLRDPTAPVLLLVDDDPSQLLSVTHFLERATQVNVEKASSGAEALARLEDARLPAVDLVLLDYFMPDMDGRETLKRMRAGHPALPIIMLTANEALEDAVMLMREGASDFITKPFNPERLRLSVEQHLTIRALKAEVARLKRGRNGNGSFSDIIGAREGLAGAVALARKAAGSDIPVLISGESGTGKELFARAIHGEGARADHPFVAVNCGAIPEHLIESTLFGHEKGSFTGAIARELGKFREAEGGTLFLDEVGELKPGMQTRLLRVLQAHEIDPVGAGKPVKVDVRIISATHRDLAHDVTTDRFREDLYYRLNVLPVMVPPLRERAGDIPALALHTLARFCASEHKPQVRVGADGMKWLEAQHWTGNVRELENLLYRAVVLSEKRELDAEDFIAMTRNVYARSAGDAGNSVALLDETGRARTLSDIEARVIVWALGRCGGNVPQAAGLLGMGQSTLYKKISGKSDPSSSALAGPL